MLTLYVLFFGVWFAINYRKHGFNISSLLISFYLFFSICSVFLLYGYDTFDESRINLYAILYHLFCYILFLLPIIIFGNRFKIDKKYFPDFKYMRILIYIVLILSAFSFIYSIPRMIHTLSMDNYHYARSLYNHRELFPDSPITVVSYLGGIGGSLSFFAFFCFFYVLAFYKNKKFLLILLFLASFTTVVINLSAMGRDGLVRWVLVAISLYVLFKDVLSPQTKKRIKQLSTLPAGLLICVLLIISLARFSGRDQSVFYYLLAYGGQQNIYFSYGFDILKEGLGGGRIFFPFLFDHGMSGNFLNRLIDVDYNLNTFSTFIGSFYLDLGRIKTLLLGFVLFIFNLSLLRGKINLFRSVYFLMLYHIVLLGSFYYMFNGSTRVNTMFVFLFLTLGVQVISYNRKKSPLKRRIVAKKEE